MAYAYQIVVEDILARIRRGEWREGQRIPPLAALERAYPQSRMTLYKALQHLTERGHLTMSRGRGTFVRAAHTRPRIAILTGSHVFGQGVATFAMQAYLHAHRILAERGMDAQLYTEDPLSPTGLPAGLVDEFERRKLAGLLTLMGSFPWGFMANPRWREVAVPHVHLGSGDAPHALDVDRGAFFGMALRAAARLGRRRVALVERQEHYLGHAALFALHADAHGLSRCPMPEAMPDPGLSFEAYGYELIRRVWAQRPRPDAVIVPDDVIAKGASQGALSLGIAVPEDLTLIALTNRGCNFFFPVPVVAMEVDVEAMVNDAVAALMDLLAGRAAPRGVRLVPPRSPLDTPTEGESPAGASPARVGHRSPRRRPRSPKRPAEA